MLNPPGNLGLDGTMARHRTLKFKGLVCHSLEELESWSIEEVFNIQVRKDCVSQWHDVQGITTAMMCHGS
jgi:hypothetical protein